MYDPDEVLAQIDSHQTTLIVIFFGILALNIALYAEAIRVGRRDRAIPFPIAMIILWFHHDFSYVIRPHHWFGDYDHWFLQCCWAIMVITAAGEAALIGQAMLYGRRELAPNVGVVPYRIGLLAVVAGSLAFFEFIHANLNDPFFLVALHVAFLLWGPFVMAMTLRRGSQRGQSLLMYGCYFGMQSLWAVATISFFGEDFRNWRWILVAAVMLAWTVASAIVFLRSPKYVPSDQQDVAAGDVTGSSGPDAVDARTVDALPERASPATS